MSVPIFTHSPINASKASGVTPQTRAPESHPTPQAPSLASATVTGSTTSSYPSPQPGASIPAPTASAQRYAPVQPTPTMKTGAEGPPAPQPGAVPTPSNVLPPPNKAEKTYHAPSSMAQPYRSQMAIPPPTSAYGAQLPTSSTSTANTTSKSYPALIQSSYRGPQQNLDHPPGYQQDTYASELSSDQRRAQDAANDSTDLSGLGGYGSSEKSSGGIDAESVWNTAKTWVSAAGEKIVETEQEIWRKINKE